MYILCYVVLFVNVLYCRCQSSTMIINVVEVRSTENVTFVCDVSSATTFTRWTNLPGYTGTSLMSFQNGVCRISPSDSFLSNRTRYSYTCNSTVYQVTLHPYHSGNLNNNILFCQDAVQYDSTISTWIIKIVQDGHQCNCDPTIAFNIKEVTEGDDVLFVYRVSTNVTYINWNVNFGSHTAAMGVQNGQCNTSTGTTFLDNTNEYIYTCNHTVYQVTRLNVQRSEHNDMYMCTPPPQQEGEGSNWIIKVKAPVKSVTMTPADNKVDVLENTAVEFTCTTSTARPSALVYWYIHPNGNSNNKTQISENITTTTDYNDFSVITSRLRFVPARHHNNMKIFCEANNSVNTSPMMSIKILLNVLYPPSQPVLKVNGGLVVGDISFIEGTTRSIECTSDSKPPPDRYTWTGRSITDSVNTETLTFNIIEKNNAGQYKCSVHNSMNPSGGVNVAGVNTTDVNVVVLYGPVVAPINNISILQGDELNIRCPYTPGVPSKTSIRWTRNVDDEQWDGEQLLLSSIKKSDTGYYSCDASNVMKPSGDNTSYIGNHSQSFYLNVLCYPRSSGVIDTDITSEKDNTITIVVNVIAYPPPTFTWWQLVNERWTELNNDDNFNIQSSNLQSNLTIRRVGMEDFTRYKVIVENEVGKMEQLYILSQYDKPDPPTGFRYLESRTTTSSIHLEWKPGFDNGPPQTFSIKYRRRSDTLWNYNDVPDNGERTMEYTLTGLTENTQYAIVILASNEKGNSSESSVLVTTTKAISGKTQSLGPMIGGVIGGTVGLVIIIALVVFVGRRNSYIHDCFGKLRKRLDATAANQGSDDTRFNRPKSVPVPTYEMINRNYIDSTPYSTLEQTEQGTTSDVTGGDKKEIYENLKTQVF